jgi:mRNA-degrading endonuclease RelE of RelBE toxin-antitoxin system
MKKRFSIKFTNKSYKEYYSLDGAIVGEVDEALESLEERADEVGKQLGKKRQINLTGAKEKKLRSSGIRIIYQITDRIVDILEIVEILLIDFKRNETDEVKFDQLSMIDQIFDENFDDMDEDIKAEILEHYAHGRVMEAYQIWLNTKK